MPNYTTNPATLPLLTTSLALFNAVLQPTIFQPFLSSHTDSPKQTTHAIELWWRHYFRYGLSTIMSLGASNLVAGVYALRQLAPGSTEYRVAATGLGFAMAHFAFGPKVGGLIARLCDEEVARRGETVAVLREWLRLHYLRTVAVDVPAVVCFAYLVFGRW